MVEDEYEKDKRDLVFLGIVVLSGCGIVQRDRGCFTVVIHPDLYDLNFV